MKKRIIATTLFISILIGFFFFAPQGRFIQCMLENSKYANAYDECGEIIQEKCILSDSPVGNKLGWITERNGEKICCQDTGYREYERSGLTELLFGEKGTYIAEYCEVIEI